MLDLQGAAGNRAVADLVAGTGPRSNPRTLPFSVQRQPPTRKGGGGAGAAGGTTAVKRGGINAPTGGTAAELTTAEAWLRYVALRGNAPAPSAPVPQSYHGIISAIQSAVAGPGPIPASELLLDELAFGDARAQAKRMRADHDRLTPKAGYEVYDLTEVAIERGQANFKGGADTWEGGANQIDVGQTLLGILSAADDELAAAKEAGYQIPKDLAELPSEAQAQFDASKKGWQGGGPSSKKLVTPTEEMDLLEFIDHARETINHMAARRAADIARAREREADALRETADKQLVELMESLAERRRAAFSAGDKGTLEKVNEALGEVNGAIKEIKDTAAIITDRVDQLNKVSEFVKGKKLIELPKVPPAISGIAGKLASAQSKISQVIDLLDLATPAKTQLESGLKYLKGVDMALEHFGGKSANPFIAVYVSAYLGPGIKNCMANIRSIAATISKQNRGLIEAGEGKYVNWQVEMGGEAMYLYLIQVYKVGPVAPVSDAAWEFLDDHRGDLEAAVGAPMPKNRRTVSVWASKNRKNLWESFYGSVKPPH
jgi:hypothetical protein